MRTLLFPINNIRETFWKGAWEELDKTVPQVGISFVGIEPSELRRYIEMIIDDIQQD